VLEDGRHFYLRQIDEQLVVLVLRLAAQDHIRTERENARRYNCKDLTALETQHPVVQQKQLVYLKYPHKGVVEPREDRVEWLYAKRVQVVADLRFVSLQQVLKELAETNDALGVRAERLQVAQVLSIKSPEDKVNLFLLIADVREWCEILAKVLTRDHSTSWEQSDGLVVGPVRNQRVVRLGFKHIVDLAISEEKHHALLHDVLKNEVLVVVANLDNIRHDEVVEHGLPASVILLQRGEVVHFFLCDVCVQDLSVDTRPQCRRHAPLGVLHKVGLVVFAQQPLTHVHPLINEGFLVVESHLAHGDVELNVLAAQVLERTRGQVDLDHAPVEIGVAGVVDRLSL
jgi:hypothetical protein